MKRDHEEEFEQDQDVNQEGLNDVECNNLENNDFSEMNNPSEDSGSNQQQTDLIQPLLDPSSIQLDGNPAKRQKRSDDEEIRLLIPSKVSIISRWDISAQSDDTNCNTQNFSSPFSNMHKNSSLAQ